MHEPRQHPFQRRYRDIVLALVGAWFALGMIRGHAQTLTLDGVDAKVVSSDVDIRIYGMVAEVKVTQHFNNPLSQPADATLSFRLPDQAAVHAMVMQVGTRRIVGRIEEKRAAERAFAAARESGKTASLVTQRSADDFRTRVANVRPGDALGIELEYVEAVSYAAGQFRLRFPLAVRGASEGAAIPSQQAVTLTVTLEPGFPLARLESVHHGVVEERIGPHRVRLTLEDEWRSDHDFELVWEPTLKATPQAAVFTQRFAGADHALVMLLPPSARYPSVQPRELILVLDSSGSMQGASIEQARESLIMALGALREGDRFNVIDFDSQAVPLFATAVDATNVNIGRAISWLEGLRADGGTNIEAALQLALMDSPQTPFLRQVVFVTDGAIADTQGVLARLDDRLGANRLFMVGIGGAPNAYFMRKAARLGRGSFTLIGAHEDVAEKMDLLLSRLEHPELTELCIDWPRQVTAYPAELPDLYQGEPLLVLARGDDLRGKAVACGKREGAPWEASLELDSPQEGFAIASLWGRTRIEHLTDAWHMLEQERPSLRAEIVATGIQYQLASMFTSFVAVDPRPPEPAITRKANLAALATDAGSITRLTLGSLAFVLGWLFIRRLRDDL